MTHAIKIWPEFFERVIDGSKTFEVRQNDRGYSEGDTVILKEWHPKEEMYTHRQVTYRIGYVHPIDGDRVVFSLLRRET